MAEYDVLARFYDELMADVDYDAIAQKLETIFTRYKLSPELILDLGCGTGSVTTALAQKGYDMIGLDRNSAMLAAALEKGQGQKILWLMQDMTSFDLYGTVDAVVCCMDGINHLARPGQVQHCFKRVSLFLNPSGLFIFDLNTVYKYETCLADNCFVQESGRVFCMWQSHFNKRSQLCRYNLTFFEEIKDGNYTRYEDEICQRSFDMDSIKKMLKSSGLKYLGAFDADTLRTAKDTSERIYIVAQKPSRRI